MTLTLSSEQWECCSEDEADEHVCCDCAGCIVGVLFPTLGPVIINVVRGLGETYSIDEECQNASEGKEDTR